MTDVPPPLNALAAAARQQHHHHHSLSTQPFAVPTVSRRQTQPPIDDGVEEDDGEIICICGMRHDDGFSVQCETCNNWQHMICYYPTEADRPGEHQKHYCFDCQPRWLDADQAKERQKKQIQRQALDSRRPGPKHRKKQKESPAVVNGSLIPGRDRKSASPRDQPPPAKRPKTGHRPSAAANHAPASRKRNGTITTARSPSPDPSRPIIPWYSEEFLRLYSQVSSHVETETNLMNNIAVTNSLSEWLKNPVVVEKDTNGLSQNDIFLRWDGPFEDMPGRPEVALHWEADSNFTDQAEPPKWPCLTVEQDISKRTFIGELRGHIGYKEEYMNDPESRWSSLRHAEPFVFFHPQLPIYIDARQEGTMFRYVRRSCRPNTEIQTIITDGTNYHFCFMATQDLQSGEEITVAWQTDDTIKAMYAERGVVHGDVPADIKYAIAMWVSNVLANCGPCACNGEGCLMARFDRRGQPQPIEPAETVAAPVKVPKARRKKTNNNLSPADPNRNSHSRSGSEARKVELDDDMTDTRSVSGSLRGSASRDITPGTHYSAVVPEMSEREKKKLMREEEMFRRQEEESGRQKKKRHSGATPLLPQSSSSKQQSSEPSSSRRGTISKRPSKPAKSGKQSSDTPKPVYVDSSVQCDMDNDDPPGPPMPTPPKKKQYLSVTQRLLRRCASNNLKRKADSETPDDVQTNGIHPGEKMDLDHAAQSPKSVGAASETTPLSPVSIKHADIDMTEATQARTASLSPAFGPVDADMQDMDGEPTRATPPIDQGPASSYSSASPSTLKPGVPSHPPMDPPPPPWPQKEAPSIGEVHPASPEFKPTHPEMHITMPPSLSSATSPPLATQSPATMTPGLSSIPLFSPSVSAAVNPSPARKKLSLSDYTKRNKVHQPRDISPANSLADSVSAKDKESILNGVAVTDSPASEQAVDATAPPQGSQESVVPPA
ncbi:hypothetical protein QM012_003669 [Aureobasidium pullulans]|uniref:SET domain-containing protein n=1 Tax=Aureobasidium pullulans TaxID=5580 RepID=A0ABR0T7J6_AURPU